MVKKIKKYLKFLVCVVLIMGLVAPSYAALSASDGSAFVTKAEFDSALADFNARLTTFEAGINSKIDSQVSSYLDRNGIWNATEFDWECVENPTWRHEIFPDVRYSYRGISIDTVTFLNGINWFTICAETPKTGMIVFEFYFIISGASYSLVCKTKPATSWYRLIGEFGLTQIQSYDAPFYSVDFDVPSLWAAEIEAGYTVKNSYIQLNTVRAFVEKNKPIYFYYRLVDRYNQYVPTGETAFYNSHNYLPLFVNREYINYQTEGAGLTTENFDNRTRWSCIVGKNTKWNDLTGNMKNAWPETSVQGVGWIFGDDPLLPNRSIGSYNIEWQNMGIENIRSSFTKKPRIY